MNRILLISVVFLGSAATYVSAADKLRVVILTGSNNHAWASTTPVLKDILEQSGHFAVDVIRQPEELTEQRLSEYDVLLSNWNNWQGGDTKESAKPWSDELKKAYTGFVRKGGGHVMVHAGSSSFFDWEDYQHICCATWKLGQTSHGPVHEFEVRMGPVEHPLSRGLENFRTTDELWARPGVAPGAQIVSQSYSEITKDWEPCALVSRFGEGRCFALLLGHSADSMQSEGFRQLLLRGTQWAASGTVTKEAVEN